MITGDWHRNGPWAVQTIDEAAARGARTIVVCGDVGLLWPGDREFTRKLEQACQRAGTVVCALDGNHDAHAALRALPVGPEGFARVDQHLWYVTRGARWAWGGRQFGALGGAYSVDHRKRREGVNLWADLEEVTPADVELLGAEPLDVLLSHEAPLGVNLVSDLALPAADRRRSDAQRALVRAAVEATRPVLVFHGHWHQRHTAELVRDDRSVTSVHGLGAQHDSGNWVLLDPITLAVVDPAPAP